MTKGKGKRVPKFHVGQIVKEKKWPNTNFHRIAKRYLGSQNDWCYRMYLGGVYLEEDLLAMTRREREGRPQGHG